MYRKILCLGIVFLTLAVKAGQPDVSTTMLVERGDNSWLLQINVPLTAFQEEIRQTYSDALYESPKDFELLVLKHIKEHLQIRFNDGRSIPLKSGLVQLGHDAQVVFEISRVPYEVHQLAIKNSVFGNLPGRQGSLFILKEGIDRGHFVFDDSNDHTLSIQVDKDKFVEVGDAETRIFSTARLLYLLAIVGVGLWVQRKFRHPKPPHIAIRSFPVFKR